MSRLVAWLLSWLVGLILLAAVLGWRYDVAYQGRIFEGVTVNGVSLGGMQPDGAAALLHERFALAAGDSLLLRAGDETWTATTADLGIRLDAVATARKAFRLGRDGSLLEQWRERFLLWRGAGPAYQVKPVYSRNPTALKALLTEIANEVARDPQDAALQIHGLSIRAVPALAGRQLDLEASQEKLAQALASNERSVDLVLKERAPFIIGAEEAAEKARALTAEPLVLFFDQPGYRPVEGRYVPTSERREWIVDRAQLVDMLHLFSHETESGQYRLDVRLKAERLRDKLKAMATAISRPPRDARFDYNPSNGVLTPLVVSQDGLKMDADASFDAIIEAIDEGEREVKLAVTVKPASVATADAEKFNITGLAVRGRSDYTGSADEREVNIAVAAKQYHGIVIPPGEVFSFNEHLGWVVDANGYEEGYIISGNRTQVDVGGGVCQVSTTVFRTAFNGGFEIVERHAHAYRVPYYENDAPMGFDATIFSPQVDFKFRNDTDNYYLMQVYNNPNTNILTIDLYGPPTGRKVDMSSAVIERVRHGPPIYETDPALAPGQTKQVDWAQNGATVRINRIIRNAETGEEIKRDAFWSKFRPWRARYLVGPGGGGN